MASAPITTEIWRPQKPHEEKSPFRRCGRVLVEFFNNTGWAFLVNLTRNSPSSGLPVMLPQWATANRERHGALTQSRTTIAGDPFYREWLCGAGQGCRGRITERLYIDNFLPLTEELFHQLAFFILSCQPISYCRFKRIDVYIL